ncbi:MAG: putative ATPase, partial [Francisellaceae bacterium]
VRFNFFNFFRKNENKISLNNAKNSQAMWTSFMYTPEATEKLDKWLSDESKMKSNYHIKIDTIENHNWLRRLFLLKPKVTKSLIFIDTFNNIEVTPREMGLGISQVLPVLVSCNVYKKAKIFIEQPELHLHPGAQCEIADEFIKSKNENENEFVIESHSEHMLLRFMKRMRQTADGILKEGDPLALTPDDVCLLYVDNNVEFTYLNELELDEEGNLLDPWPNGFFEEGYKERFS